MIGNITKTGLCPTTVKRNTYESVWNGGIPASSKKTLISPSPRASSIKEVLAMPEVPEKQHLPTIGNREISLNQVKKSDKTPSPETFKPRVMKEWQRISEL